MQRIKTIKDMQALSRRLMSEKKSIGFAPTMGALHEGHLSLVRRSKEENAITVVSIFINPIQFGPKEDFNKYPRGIDGDLKKLSLLDVDFVFIPEIVEMYPDGFSININVGGIGNILCGAVRQGHFNGVATVVAKLLNIVMPHRVYFGQKDFQQTVIIKKLVRELNFDMDIIVCPTAREADGLAMSSRNIYLSPTERKSASILYRALKHGEGLILQGKQDASYVKTDIEKILNSEPLVSIEYIGIVKPQSLESVEMIDSPVVICLAARIGTTRLIDNLPVSP